jgi:glutathione peroxidase-family protein
MNRFFVAVLTVCVVFLSSFTTTDTEGGYKVGETITDFKLKNIDGKMVSLADYSQAKGFIIVFTCNHCPFSQAYEQRIIDLHKKYAAKGYPVIAINPNDKTRSPEDSYENMIVRAKEKKYPFVYLYDETQTVARTFGATRTPHVFVVSKKKAGNIVEYIGAIDDNSEEPKDVTEKYVENALNALLSGKSVTKNNTKAIGCTIKWKK